MQKFETKAKAKNIRDNTKIQKLDTTAKAKYDLHRQLVRKA